MRPYPLYGANPKADSPRLPVRLRKRSEVEADEVVRALATIAFFDPRTVLSCGPGGLAAKSLDDLSAENRAGILEIAERVTKRGRTLRITFHDKVRALMALAKHLNLLSPQDPHAKRLVEIIVTGAQPNERTT